MILPLLAALAVQCPDGTPPPCRTSSVTARPAAPAAPQAGSIAVFPFTNRSPDSSDAYLADALPEQIIGRLARVQDLKVKSATAVSAQWRRTPDAMTAARALRVEWFVSGSIRRVGRQLSVSAELVRATSGDGAWSAPFRRGDDDLAAVEEQIAESVAVGVIGRLAPGEVTALRRGSTRNTEAYRLYLYGRSIATRRTTADIQTAVESFTRAVRLDSNFAAAWARLGYVRGLQRQWGNTEGLSGDSLSALAFAAIDHALRLDSNLAEAWLALGSTMFVVNGADYAKAWNALQRSLRLDSLSADTWHSIGYLYSVDRLQLPEEAERCFRRALELDPDLRNSWLFYGLARLSQGRPAEAEALLDSALARGQWGRGLAVRAQVRFARGNGTGALADLADAERLGNLPIGTTNALPFLRAKYALAAGDSAPAIARLDRSRASVRAGGPGWDDVAQISAALGRDADALEALEQLRRSADPEGEPRCGPAPCSTSVQTWRLLHDPVFVRVRSDPRFQRLLEDTRPRVPWLGR